MDARYELYESLKARLEEIEEVSHVDLWNEDVDYMGQDAAWQVPAVFVQFDRISWQSMAGGKYRGEGLVVLHIVTQWYEGGYETAFGISEKIREALRGFKGKQFDVVHLTHSDTNHSHEEVLENIDSYTARYYI